MSREPWICHGTEQNSYDRLVRLDCPPLRMGDEDWFYATVSDRDHASFGGYIRDFVGTIQGALYTQKHNRYVSLTAGNRPRILITKPVKVTGKTLQLNVDANRGEVKVAVAIDKLMKHKTGQWPFQANQCGVARPLTVNAHRQLRGVKRPTVENCNLLTAGGHIALARYRPARTSQVVGPVRGRRISRIARRQRCEEFSPCDPRNPCPMPVIDIRATVTGSLRSESYWSA